MHRSMHVSAGRRFAWRAKIIASFGSMFGILRALVMFSAISSPEEGFSARTYRVRMGRRDLPGIMSTKSREAGRSVAASATGQRQLIRRA